MIRRIHVRHRLTIDADADLAVVERVHGFHAERCPVARSLRGAIEITTELETSSG